MTTRLQRTILVPGTPESVFAYVADFSNAAEWDPGIVAARRLTDGPVGLGSRFELVAEFMGRELDTVYEVIGHDPPKRVVVAGGSSRFASTDEITVTPADGGVEVRYEAEFRLSGVMAVAEPFLRGRFRKVAEDAVAGLQRRLGA